MCLYNGQVGGACTTGHQLYSLYLVYELILQGLKLLWASVTKGRIPMFAPKSYRQWKGCITTKICKESVAMWILWLVCLSPDSGVRDLNSSKDGQRYVLLTLMHWIAIYLPDIVIHTLKNRSQHSRHTCTLLVSISGNIYRYRWQVQFILQLFAGGIYKHSISYWDWAVVPWDFSFSTI